MRIIGGKFRGKKLTWLQDTDTRPTTDRVRENIFNILSTRIRGAIVLDLFAGCGAFSAEALSRGAKQVIANDSSKEAVEIITKNIESLEQHHTNQVRDNNRLGKVKIFQSDFRTLIPKLSGFKFDVVFLDPPYFSGFASLAVELLIRDDLLAPNAKIIIESDKGEDISLPLACTERIYGRAKVRICLPSL